MRQLAAARPLLGAAAVAVALVVALTLALTPRPGLAPLIAVEQLSAASGTFLSQLAASLPLGYAFGAGMVAAVNPCGFALLPVYFGLYLGLDRSRPAPLPRRLLKALAVGATVTAAFVLVFGLVGLTVGLTRLALGAYLAWLGLAVGLLLVVGGGVVLAGGQLPASFAQRLADRLGGTARLSGLPGYAAFGLAYGISSLDCTLPIFLAVVGSSLAGRGVAAVSVQLVLYALGMGFVLSVLAVVAALVRVAAFGGLRRLGAYVEPAGALLLLVTGGYLVYYWLSSGVLLR